jgi:hypothetical protein
MTKTADDRIRAPHGKPADHSALLANCATIRAHWQVPGGAAAAGISLQGVPTAIMRCAKGPEVWSAAMNN